MFATRRLGIRTVRVLAVLFVLEVAIGLGCADTFLLHPSREPVDAGGASALMLPTAQGDVQVWRLAPLTRQQPPFAVLSFIGNADRAEWRVGDVARRYDRVAEIWSVNYPGFGASAGQAKLKAIPPAALAAYDALRQRLPTTPIVVDGVSIGCTAALYVASQRPCVAVVLTNPPPLKRLILGNYGWWNLWIAAACVAHGVPDELDTLRTAPRVNVPGVFIFADQDQVVPPKYHQMVYDAYAGPKQIIVLHGAGHNDEPSVVEQEQIVRAIAGVLRDPAHATQSR